jgi:hypothetical protein
VTVAIDPQFANIVNTGVQYHVFLTPSGDCKGLYVASRSALGFEVRELGNGGSAVEFDYRIVAKRTGHESERLADATEEMHGLTKLRDDLAARRAKPHPAAKPAMAEQKDLPVLPMGPPPAPQQQPTRMPGSGQGKPAAEGHEVAEVAQHQQ